jgi:phosphoribosylpyrophosphate synthetase
MMELLISDALRRSSARRIAAVIRISATPAGP